MGFQKGSKPSNQFDKLVGQAKIVIFTIYKDIRRWRHHDSIY